MWNPHPIHKVTDRSVLLEESLLLLCLLAAWGLGPKLCLSVYLFTCLCMFRSHVSGLIFNNDFQMHEIDLITV